MKIWLIASFITLSAHSSVECLSGNMRFAIQVTAKNEISITFENETVIADGIVTEDEVDLIAKFIKAGEMTLVAKIGNPSPDNYLFLKGKRLPISCK